MLEFNLWNDESNQDRKVHIDPREVSSVRETENRRAYGGWNPTAVISMRNGDQFEVYDGARTAAKRIRSAKVEAKEENA